jgi:hypothetical protein
VKKLGGPHNIVVGGPLKMSASRGYLVNIHEKCDSEGFQLIGSFVSKRRAGEIFRD